jgi:hypothetical protein
MNHRVLVTVLITGASDVVVQRAGPRRAAV